MPRSKHVRKVKVTKGTLTAMDSLKKDIRALNSAILMISQKIKYLVRNEKILGRNLIVLNKKIKMLSEEGPAQGALDPAQLGNLSTDMQALSDRVEQNTAELAELGSELATIRDTYATGTALKEVKYVIDSINPLEFVTYKDVEGIVDQKLKARGKK